MLIAHRRRVGGVAQPVHDLAGGGAGHRGHNPAEVPEVVKMQSRVSDCLSGGEERPTEAALGVERSRHGVREQQRRLGRTNVLA